MKRIVICCDGTWKRLDEQHPTNVVRLAQAVLPRGGDGIEQVTYHLDGVGSGRGTGGVSRLLDRALGGLFGRGLMATIEDAYRFLIFNYAPGDEVYLFGFSRGAYTARSLSGLIRNCGILSRANARSIGKALTLYRSRGARSRPDAEVCLKFRARYSSHVVTSEEEARWRAENGHAAGASVPVELRYLGVWDTVGALGIPRHLRLAAWCNRGLQFHDTRLSRSVRAARHAVAIDERRRMFPPALWDNLDALNAEAEAGDQPFQQHWFPGDHTSIGGGGKVALLSNNALVWVAEGAQAAGLALDEAALEDWRVERDCLAPLGSARGMLAALLQRDAADRPGPSTLAELATAGLRRWRADPSYRPRPLRRLARGLNGADAAPAA